MFHQSELFYVRKEEIYVRIVGVSSLCHPTRCRFENASDLTGRLWKRVKMKEFFFYFKQQPDLRTAAPIASIVGVLK